MSVKFIIEFELELGFKWKELVIAETTEEEAFWTEVATENKVLKGLDAQGNEEEEEEEAGGEEEFSLDFLILLFVFDILVR